MKKRSVEIAVSVEYSREWGRKVCEGIAAYAQLQPGWHLSMFKNGLSNAATLKHFDGFLWGISDERTALALKATGRPIVDLFGLDVSIGGITGVGVDHAACGELAAQTFISHQFRNFAYFGWKDLPHSRRRQLPYMQALERANYKCHTYLSSALTTLQYLRTHVWREQLELPSDARAIGRWVAKLPKPVGVFCANDMRAWQLAEICRNEGIRVPGDVAIVGVDNDPIFCLFSSLSLSSVDTNSFEIGRRAAEVLDGLMAGDRTLFERDIRIEPIGVVNRSSTAVYPVDPSWLGDILVHIRTNVADALTADDIAAYAGKSYGTVENAFKRVLHTTVQKEIMSARLDTAEHLLKTTVMPVGEIAARSGFKSARYFNYCFAARHHQSPGQWRAC